MSFYEAIVFSEMYVPDVKDIPFLNQIPVCLRQAKNELASMPLLGLKGPGRNSMSILHCM